MNDFQLKSVLMFGIPLNLIIYGSIAILCIFMQYPLRHIKLFAIDGHIIIIKFAALIYKIFPVVAIVYGIYLGTHLSWFSPFLFGLITWLIAMIIYRIEFKLNLLPIPVKTPRFLMFCYALLHIAMIILLFIHT